MEQEAVNSAHDELKAALSSYLPNVEDVRIDYHQRRASDTASAFDIIVNDGVETSLSSKGSGVASLTAIAMIQGRKYGDAMIAIEEPEGHLHADAIHKVRDRLLDSSKNAQILISTHNPSFVSPQSVKSIYSVSQGKCLLTQRRREIRQELGLSLGDSLFLADNVIFVEGETDQTIIIKVLSIMEPNVAAMIETSSLGFVVGTGAKRVWPIISLAQSLLVNCFAVFDGDKDGRDAANDIKARLHADLQKCPVFVFPNPAGKSSCEIEDHLPASIVCDVLRRYGLDAKESEFTAFPKRFHEYFAFLLNRAGCKTTDIPLLSVKNEIANAFSRDCDPCSKFEDAQRAVWESLIASTIEALDFQ